MKVFRGTLEEYREELIPLFKKHWEEIGMVGSEGLSLNINEDYYKALNACGQYLAIGLRNDDDKLIGYLSLMVYNHPHHEGTNFALTDCFIVDKDYRGLSVFKSIIKMFKLAEKILIQEFNVTHMQFVCSVGKDLTPLAKRMGYIPSDIMFIKKLEVN